MEVCHVEPGQLVFIRMRWEPTPPWLPFSPTNSGLQWCWPHYPLTSDIHALGWELSLPSWIPEYASMRPSRRPGQCHRNTLYAPIGQRAFFKILRNRGANTTLLTSVHVEGMGSSMAVEGATTSQVFETYVERLLIPVLRPVSSCGD
jgi:hypothetical protein